ncbi:MAG: OsmC family protein [Bdellovibrionota bacterium]
MSTAHEFRCHLTWTGAKAGKPFTYDTYSRDFLAETPGKPPLPLSGAEAFKGDPAKSNPEDLLVASLSACHALTYLAICSRSKVTVLAYEDEASGTLEKVGDVMKFTSVTLRPKVTLSKADDETRALTLHEKAHHQCFIANSVNFEVRVEPQIVVGG